MGEPGAMVMKLRCKDGTKAPAGALANLPYLCFAVAKPNHVTFYRASIHPYPVRFHSRRVFLKVFLAPPQDLAFINTIQLLNASSLTNDLLSRDLECPADPETPHLEVLQHPHQHASPKVADPHAHRPLIWSSYIPR